MKKLLSTYRILFMFVVPSIVFLYFSYKYIQTQYIVQENASEYKYSIKVINELSDLIHDIQLERGLSSGYLETKDLKIKENLEQHYISINNKIKEINTILNQDKFKIYIDKRNQELLLSILNNLKKISSIRDKILNLSISFQDEIKYYTNINANLILFIKYLNCNFIHIHKDANTIEQLQLLKEYSGLERAYVYNQLLSVKKNNDYVKNIQILKQKHKIIERELLFRASPKSLLTYKMSYSKSLENEINECRKKLIINNVNSIDAQKCFTSYTNYINMFNNINIKILDTYNTQTHKIYTQAVDSLYIILLIWTISFILILFIIITLIKLIKKDAENRLELKISAYTFEAYEGVVITDLDGVILKVNTSFTDITGYSSKEAIGQTPRILKSDKHHDNFYKNMWDELIKNGKWQGDIFNKRKNGEEYLETLSISAISDSSNNETTHYIAQFIDQSEMKKIQEELRHQVNHDFLTSLLNRKALTNRLHEEYIKALRYNFLHSLLFIDLDNFKNVNDTYGHDIGDKLIIEVANRLKLIVREGDIVFRISGDEFVIILLNLNNNKTEAVESIKLICEKILKDLSRKFILDEYEVIISASIGVKLFPEREDTTSSILINADEAMYKAKMQGRNKFIFHNE